MNQSNLVYFVKQNINFLTPVYYPLNHISFQVSAHHNPLLNTFYCFHGNWPKIQNSEIVKKFVEQYHQVILGLWLSNVDLWWPKGTPKSTFPYLLSNMLVAMETNVLRF